MATMTIGHKIAKIAAVCCIWAMFGAWPATSLGMEGTTIRNMMICNGIISNSIKTIPRHAKLHHSFRPRTHVTATSSIKIPYSMVI